MLMGRYLVPCTLMELCGVWRRDDPSIPLKHFFTIIRTRLGGAGRIDQTSAALKLRSLKGAGYSAWSSIELQIPGSFFLAYCG